MIKDLKKTVIINAGHWDNPDTAPIDDPGASHDHAIEAEETMKVRDRVVPILERHGIVVLKVPDELDLRKSISWANQKAPKLNDALAVDIHFNSLSNKAARGSEAFYGTSAISKSIAQAMTDHVSSEMSIPNRGAKPDTQTYVGSLGWIRKTTMWATLVEICFLTNTKDMAVIQGLDGYEKAARGVAKAVLETMGVAYKEEATPPIKPEEDLFVCDSRGNRIYKLTKI